MTHPGRVRSGTGQGRRGRDGNVHEVGRSRRVGTRQHEPPRARNPSRGIPGHHRKWRLKPPETRGGIPSQLEGARPIAPADARAVVGNEPDLFGFGDAPQRNRECPRSALARDKRGRSGWQLSRPCSSAWCVGERCRIRRDLPCKRRPAGDARTLAGEPRELPACIDGTLPTLRARDRDEKVNCARVAEGALIRIPEDLRPGIRKRTGTPSRGKLKLHRRRCATVSGIPPVDVPVRRNRDGDGDGLAPTGCAHERGHELRSDEARAGLGLSCLVREGSDADVRNMRTMRSASRRRRCVGRCAHTACHE